MRRIKKFSLGRRMGLGVLTVAAVGAISAGVALSAGSTGVPVQKPPPAPLAQATNPTIASQLAVLSRPATAEDKLPEGIEGNPVHWLQEEQVGANGGLARRVASSKHGPIYLIPSAQGVCVLATDGPPNICSSAAELEKGEAQEAILCSPSIPNTEVEIAGLLPDGTTNADAVLADGSATSLSLEGNTFVADFPRSGSLPKEIRWTTAGGKVETASTQVPANAATEGCAAPPAH